GWPCGGGGGGVVGRVWPAAAVTRIVGFCIASSVNVPTRAASEPDSRAAITWRGRRQPGPCELGSPRDPRRTGPSARAAPTLPQPARPEPARSRARGGDIRPALELPPD